MKGGKKVSLQAFISQVFMIQVHVFISSDSIPVCCKCKQDKLKHMTFNDNYDFWHFCLWEQFYHTYLRVIHHCNHKILKVKITTIAYLLSEADILLMLESTIYFLHDFYLLITVHFLMLIIPTTDWQNSPCKRIFLQVCWSQFDPVYTCISCCYYSWSTWQAEIYLQPLQRTKGVGPC